MAGRKDGHFFSMECTMLKQSLSLFKTSFKQRKSNYKYLFITLILEAISIALLYNLNSQYGFLYQGIQDYNNHLIWKSIIIFASIALVLVFINGYASYFTNRLAFSIREGLTDHFLDKLTSKRSVENIEQRIQEDLRNFGQLSCDFWLSVLKAVVKLPLFLSVIITLTQWYVGIIILIAVIIGTWLTKLFAKKLIELQVIQETNEANFRKAVAVKEGFLSKWVKIKVLFLNINTQLKKLNFLQSGLGQTFVLLPFIILIPLYLAKQITMGAFFQSVNALSKVIDSLTILIDNRQLLANIQTCLKRMESLND